MANPWLRRNPLLSLWRGAANTALGVVRGHAAAALRKRKRKVR